MNGAKGSEGALRVIFAVEGGEERSAFEAAMEESSPGCILYFPTDIAQVEAIYAGDGADAIVTDLRFHGGALADWLAFWPLPTILVVEPGEDMGRVEKVVRDEAALFVHRSPGGDHSRALPLLIRKALNIRESNARQNAYLQRTERQYMNLLQAIPDIVYILDGKGRFTYLNEAVRNLGYEPSSLIGKHFSEIVHPDDVPKLSREEVLKKLKGVRTGDEGAPKLFDERRSGERMTRNLELRVRLGALAGGFRVGSVNSYGEVNSVGYALPEFEGADLGTVGIIRDISFRMERQRALEAALAARDILIKEIHHRVKNNLQIVSSLLSIQESGIGDEASREVFKECQTQIQTMSMVHEFLYRSANFEGVEMQSYFVQLIDYLSSVYDAAGRGVSCEIEAEGATLFLDEAIPVALAANELVSNSLKHAFPAGRGGRIAVRMVDSGEDWRLEVEDDGVGFGSCPDEGPPADSGIGTELVEALAMQVRGTVSREPGKGGMGALVRIDFPKKSSQDIKA
jgi:PAS domain S-box-containing protein